MGRQSSFLPRQPLFVKTAGKKPQHYHRKHTYLVPFAHILFPWKDRTLEDITRDAIHTVLTDLDGNQSRAARTLGISRATLWRVLKEEPEKP